MRILTLLILSFILNFNSYSQCKKKVDEFTGKTYISSELKTIGKNKEYGFDTSKKLTVTTSYNSSLNTLKLILYPESTDIQDIDQGDIVYFKFVDGEISQLDVRDVGDNNFTSGNPTIWYRSVWLLLDDAEIERFLEKPIAKIRCGRHDYTVKEKDSKMIAKQIKCVMALK